MMMGRARCMVLMVLLSMASPCAAQNPPAARNPAPPNGAPQLRDPKACSQPQQPRSGSDPRAPDAGNQNLSQTLEQSEGVICPPDIDPDITAPTPRGGAMSVIPPPGSPGGDPTVRPK
jgi:hypothetical protein